MRDHRGEYNELDLLWTHPSTGARVFIGNYTASKSLETLEARQITHVVNCMARNTDSSLKDRFEYYRFPIETWEGEMVRRGGDPGGESDGDFLASRYFERLFAWLDAAMEQPGHAVLIHCFAGAHRAAAVSVAYLMHAARLCLQDALAAVKHARPIADPYGLLMELLERLDACMGHSTACAKPRNAEAAEGAAGEDVEALVGNNASIGRPPSSDDSKRRQRKIDALRQHESLHGLNVQQARILKALVDEQNNAIEAGHN